MEAAEGAEAKLSDEDWVPEDERGGRAAARRSDSGMDPLRDRKSFAA